jgi:hypothetical protein
MKDHMTDALCRELSDAARVGIGRYLEGIRGASMFGKHTMFRQVRSRKGFRLVTSDGTFVVAIKKETER